jgi:hypothetical protein
MEGRLIIDPILRPVVPLVLRPNLWVDEVAPLTTCFRRNRLLPEDRSLDLLSEGADPGPEDSGEAFELANFSPSFSNLNKCPGMNLKMRTRFATCGSLCKTSTNSQIEGNSK